MVGMSEGGVAYRDGSIRVAIRIARTLPLGDMNQSMCIAGTEGGGQQVSTTKARTHACGAAGFSSDIHGTTFCFGKVGMN